VLEAAVWWEGGGDVEAYEHDFKMNRAEWKVRWEMRWAGRES
jgi:hypothetical protein